ncbi:hypothetical protein BH10ACT7_BH10ACT7_29960 [soil metagenome]
MSTLAFLGDEITLGGDWASWFPDRETLNLGVEGDSTEDLVARREDVIEANPGSVVLLIGSNDVSRRKSVEHIVRNIQYLMVTLRTGLPGARLLLQSVVPRDPARADQLLDANRHLRQFCPSLNAQFLDLWPALASVDGGLRDEFTTDGVHLTAAGYEAWLTELRPALERLDEAPPMTRPIPVQNTSDTR